MHKKKQRKPQNMCTYIQLLLNFFQLHPFLYGFKTTLVLGFFFHEEKKIWIDKLNCLALLKALKRMLLVKASGGGEKTMHHLPQMMQAYNK